MKASDFNLKKFYLKEAIVVPATESCSCGCDCGKAICESCGKKNHTQEGWARLPDIDREKYQPRDGLEGPIMTRSGKVVYYDNVEGKYYDPDTDMYLTYDEWKAFDPELPIKESEQSDVKAILDKHNITSVDDIEYGSKAYEELFGYYMDSGEMPYGTMKARDGDPDQWIADRVSDLGLVNEDNSTDLMKQYKDNEHNNYHSENNLLLAKAFGTPKEVKMVELVLAKNKKQGYTDTMDSEWMYHNIHKKYYPELVKGSLGEKFTEKQRLDPKCWKGYKKDGTKMKGGVRVNNCVPESESIFDESWDEDVKEDEVNEAMVNVSVGSSEKFKDGELAYVKSGMMGGFKYLGVATGFVKHTKIMPDDIKLVTVLGTQTGDKSTASTVGRAAVGALVAGPFGALIGGMTGKNKQEHNIGIETADGSKHIFSFKNKDKEYQSLTNWAKKEGKFKLAIESQDTEVEEVAKHGSTEYYRELDKGQLNHTKSMLMKTAGQLNVAIEQRYKFSKELMGDTGDRAGTGDLQKMLDSLNNIIAGWDEETKLYGK